MSAAPGSSVAERVGSAYALPIFTAADFLHSAIALLENDAIENPQRDPSVYLCVRCLRRVTRYESETGVGWPSLLLPDDCTTLPDPAADLFDPEPATPASSPVARPSSCPPLRVVDLAVSENADYTEIASRPSSSTSAHPSDTSPLSDTSAPLSDTSAPLSDTSSRLSDTSSRLSDTSARSSNTSARSSDAPARSSDAPARLSGAPVRPSTISVRARPSSPAIAIVPATPPAIPEDFPPIYMPARPTNYSAANGRPDIFVDPPPYSLPPVPPRTTYPTHTYAPFAAGWDPYVPWVSPPSSSTTWCVVKIGRRVGVFDSRIDAVTATRGMTCENPVREYMTRDAAIVDFTAALGRGAVHVVRTHD